MLKILKFSLVLVFLAAGVNDIYLGLANRNPTTISADRFVRDTPDSGWYHVTGGYLDHAHGSPLGRACAAPVPDEAPCAAGRHPAAVASGVKRESAGRCPGAPPCAPATGILLRQIRPLRCVWRVA